MTIRISLLRLVLFIATLVFVIGAGSVFAQENEEQIAKQYGITFPIAELGNCANFSACKSYCDKEVNQDTCISFAKKKGFYKDGGPQGKSTAIIKAAKSELGCDSESACRTICEKEENIEKCSAFAKKHNLGEPRQNPGDRQILDKAKEILGCDSESSCRLVCEKPENQEKCSEFAKQTGLGGGIHQVGPGGCNSEESCRAYCQTHMDECRQFGGGENQGQQEQSRQGPGGCNSEESCNVYCKSHPEECGGLNGSGEQEVQENFCKENPDKCNQERNGPSNMNPEEFCRQNPDKCKPQDANSQYEGANQKPPDDQQYYQQQDQPQQYPTGEYRQEQNSTSQQSVQGTTTRKSIWEILLDFFRL